MTIRYLAREGEKIATLARRFGLSRQTIYNQLKRTTDHATGRTATERTPRKRRPSALDPFRDYIRARLEQFDLPATVLFRELKAQGYTGGMTILRGAIRPFKAEQVRRVTERFETTPGHQAQIDWGECGTITVGGPAGGETRKLYLFVMVLGYSRMLYARFTTSTRQPALFSCLKGAFETLGIPKELLVDNMKQCVERHDVSSGVVRFSKAFLDFAEHYDVQPVASPPYWPRVKGKVERGVGYVKRSFLEGRSFTDLADLNAQLTQWLLTVANQRVHGTTKAVPAVRFEEEMSALRSARLVPPFDARPVELRVVALDSHLSYRGVRYSVLPEAAGHTVVVRASGDVVGDVFTVMLGEKVVAEHRIRPRGTPDVTLAEHRSAVRALTRRGSAPRHGEHRGERPGKHQPRFVQHALLEVADAPASTLESIQRLAPVVETRTLEEYAKYGACHEASFEEEVPASHSSEAVRAAVGARAATVAGTGVAA
jgi:transposase